MKKRHSIFSLEPGEGINLTPLLDIIFNLVFFFLLATTMRQQKAVIEVNIPEASTGVEISAPESQVIIINITEENVIIVDGHVYTPAELSDYLIEQNSKREPENLKLTAIVRGDGESNFATMVKAMESCSLAGIGDVAIQIKRVNESR
jgi:biopolymer transport protein ExbD